MKLEMFCGETLRGYVMNKEFIFKKINYRNGSIEMAIKNCRTIGQWKKKVCKCYGLGMDIIIVDSERRVLDENLILQKHPEELWICLNDSGSLTEIELSKIEYEIILNGSVHNFMAVMCNAWNHRSVEFYINCLTGGEQKKVNGRSRALPKCLQQGAANRILFLQFEFQNWTFKQ
jgi:hypothetical protein